MAKFIVSILAFILFPLSLQAFNGEKRLPKRNIVSIKNNEDASLLLNDEAGNLFRYNGNDTRQVEFINNIDSPTYILSQQNGVILYAVNHSVYLKKDHESQEILSIPKFEKINKAVQNDNFYFISTSSALYQIEKSSNEVIELYKDNIDKTDKLACSEDDCYVAMNNLIINLSKEGIVQQTLPNSITDIVYNAKVGLIALTDGQIFIGNKDGSRKLFSAIGEIPNNIISICGSERWLFLITDNTVHVFDWINSEIKTIGNYNGFLTASHIDNWDNLWLASNQGLWNFPSYKNEASPKILDAQITDRNNQDLDTEAIKFTKELHLINITPEVVYLPNNENISLQWRVEDREWKTFTTDFALSNEMVEDGISNIFIRAKSDISEYSLPYTLTINNQSNQVKIPSIWYAILGLIGSLLVVSFISLFNSRTKENEGRLEIEKLKMENALLQSRQQIDQLKMNPHFIFNALNSINGLIATGKIAESRKSISLFSKFLRQFLYQSQDEAILLEDEIELLDNYVRIEQIGRDGKFTFHNELSDDSLIDVKIPNMIIQPFIENAIVHAFPDLNNKGEIKLILSEEDGYLVANIIDNGIGFNKSKPKQDHKSIAIDLVRKRLAQRDKNRRKSYVEYSSNDPGTIAKVYLQKL